MNKFGRCHKKHVLLLLWNVGQVFACWQYISSPFLNSGLSYGGLVQSRFTRIDGLRSFISLSVLLFLSSKTTRRMTELKETQAAERQRLEVREDFCTGRFAQQRENASLWICGQVGQTFVALSMGLRGLAQNIEQVPKHALGKQANGRVASNGVQDLQRLISGLHPPQLDDLGLVAALRWYANDLDENNPMKIEINSQIPHLSLPSDLRVVLFRIAQEALTNISRHANATHVEVEIFERNSFFVIVIRDNGIGFSVDKTLAEAKDTPCWGFWDARKIRLVGGQHHITDW
jgi:signal transduction histidine kinase